MLKPSEIWKNFNWLTFQFFELFLAYLLLQFNSYRLQMFYKKNTNSRAIKILLKKNSKGHRPDKWKYLLWKYSTSLHTCSVYFFACFCFISLPMNSVFLCNQFYTLGLYFCRKIFTFVHRGQRAWPILRRT